MALNPFVRDRVLAAIKDRKCGMCAKSNLVVINAVPKITFDFGANPGTHIVNGVAEDPNTPEIDLVAVRCRECGAIMFLDPSVFVPSRFPINDQHLSVGR